MMSSLPLNNHMSSLFPHLTHYQMMSRISPYHQT